MSHQLTTTRAARNRRLVAITAWGALIATAMILWNGRTQGLLPRIVSEPVAFLLAAFVTFVSLFAWMLYNPARGVSAETPTLMFAGAATLFTPCVIGFCLMPPDSPLRGWLVVGLFLLLAISIMSPVPDEFFAIPREHHTYLQPMPILDISDRSVRDHSLSWFNASELARLVDTDRLSLAPSAWRYGERYSAHETERRGTAPAMDDLDLDDDFSEIDFRPDRAPDFTKRVPDRPPSARQLPPPRKDTRRETQSPEHQPTLERRSQQPRRPASIWFRPRPVVRSVDSPAVPFGPPRPSGYADAKSQRVLPSQITDNRIPRVPESPAVQQSHSQSVDRGNDSEPVTGVRGPAGGIQSRTSGIASAAMGFAGAAASAIPSVFRPRRPNVDLPRADAPDPLLSDVGADERNEFSDPGVSTFTRSDAGDTIQVADDEHQRTFERTRDEQGGELLEGTMRVHFDRGQKRANLHIPFSPPLPGIPEVECEAIGGESLRLKVPERRSYGIRIEARRVDADEPLDTDIGFAAVYVPER